MVWVPARGLQLAMDIALGHAGSGPYPGGLSALLAHAPSGVLAPQGRGVLATPDFRDVVQFVVTLCAWFVAGTFATGAAILVTTARLNQSEAGPVTALRWVVARWRAALSGRLRFVVFACLAYALGSLLISVLSIAIVMTSAGPLAGSTHALVPWVFIGFALLPLLGPPLVAAVLAARRILALSAVLAEGVPASMAMARSGALLSDRGRLTAAVLAFPVLLVAIGDAIIYVLSPLIESTHPALVERYLWYLLPGLLVTVILVPLLGVAQAVLYDEARTRDARVYEQPSVSRQVPTAGRQPAGSPPNIFE
jgi:hypothetical protein